MKKSLVISEQDAIAAVLENDRVVEFFVNRGELLLGDIYSASVENILPGIDAAFVNLGKDKMGFLHANDVPGQGALKERLVPRQKLLVQITKEPTGHKGPRVSTAISLPGRFLVLVPEERGVSISRRISEARERARLKAVVNLMKPPGIGLIIRTEAKGQGEQELFEDFEQLWDRWQTIVSEGEASIGSALIYRDQDLLYRVIRDAYSHDVSEIICDTADGQRRAQEYLHGWAGKQTRVSFHQDEESLLISKGIDKEIEAALSDRVELPSGGHLNIQPTEALTVIDVNSGRFTSSRTQAETVRRTNLEASQEIPRQLRLRNIGGMVIVDFIDMDSRKDQQQVLEVFQRVLEEDRAKPQVGQLSDLGLVELTRRRQGQSLRELFTVHCSNCAGIGVVPTLELGPMNNRRIISFKAREEELTRARGGSRRQSKPGSGVLRAATASNGRILPTHTEESEDDALSFVPEEILEQMPDELLPGASTASSLSKFGTYASQEDDDEHEDDDTFKPSEDSKISNSLDDYHFVADQEDLELSNQLVNNISAVEEVYNDMGRRSQPAMPDHSNVNSVNNIKANNANETVTISAYPMDQMVKREEPEFSTPASPFETEFDPATGVYRLKVKGTTSGEPYQNEPQLNDEGEGSRQSGSVSDASERSLEQGEQEGAGGQGAAGRSTIFGANIDNQDSQLREALDEQPEEKERDNQAHSSETAEGRTENRTEDRYEPKQEKQEPKDNQKPFERPTSFWNWNRS